MYIVLRKIQQTLTVFLQILLSNVIASVNTLDIFLIATFCSDPKIIEVFRNEILAACQSTSLTKRLNAEVILIFEFMNSEKRITSNKFCRICSHF